MGAKVTFDPIKKVISITEPPKDVNGDLVVEIDVKTDIYSDGKEDWVNDERLRRFKFPVRAIGGNPLPGSRALGTTFFLDPEWKIRPYEADHILRVNGNLYSEDGTSPFTRTLGNYNIFLEQQVSSLVDSTIQQLPEIQRISFRGGVWLDATATHPYSTGTEYPAGNSGYPTNNADDAVAIAKKYGFDTIYVIGDFNFINVDISNFTIIGQNPMKSTIYVDASCNAIKCEFFECALVGVFDGESTARKCVLTDVQYINGYVYKCILGSSPILLSSGVTGYFLDCYSGIAGTSSPILDFGGSGQEAIFRRYSGGLTITNKSGPESASFDLDSGIIKIDSSVTNGTIIVRGDGAVIDTNGNLMPTGTYNGNLNLINQTVNSSNFENIWADSRALTVAKYLGLK